VKTIHGNIELRPSGADLEDYEACKLAAMKYARAGRTDQATEWTRRALKMQPLFNFAAILNAKDDRAKVLVIQNIDQLSTIQFDQDGNLRMRGGPMGGLPQLAADKNFIRAIGFVGRGFDYDILRNRLSQFDIVVNALSDPDTHVDILRELGPVLRDSGLPIINPPHLIEANSRDAVCEILRRIEGLIYPRTEKLIVRDRSATALASTMRGRSFDCPVLVRPCGSHRGYGLVRVDTDDDWPKAAAQLISTGNDPAYYVSNFIDYADDEGLFRKFRVFCVGERLIATHCLTSDDWMVHWDSARAMMATRPELIEYEKAFLADFPARINGSLGDKLRLIRQAIGLDFFGIDCTLMRNGKLLVFEANPAMIHTTPTLRRDYPHLVVYLEAVEETFRALVRDKITGGRQTRRH
jgi:glutathione synthase/RimK-type ligase-like ATP-grasp enzyme